MAEYYTVLKRAISSIDPNVADGRRAVYDKARNALIGQLKAVDPPLTTAEISRQRLELEEAIRRVERESAAGVAPPAAAAPVPSHAEPPRRPEPIPVAARSATPPPAYQEPPRATPQDVFRRAIQEAGIRGGAAPGTVERAALPARSDVVRQSATAPDLRRPDDRPVRREPPRRPPPPPEPRYHVAETLPPESYEPEPRLAPEYDQDWEEAPQPSATRAPPPPRPGPEVDSRDRLAFARDSRRRGYVEDDDAELLDSAPRRSRLPGIILVILIVAVVGGLGALAWSQRVVLSDLLASFESSEPPSPTEQPVTDTAAASGKNSDRLLAGDQPAPAPDSDVRVVDGQPDTGGQPDAAGQPGSGDEMATAMPGGDTQPLPVSASGGATGDTPVQKAILYEEPVGNAAGDSGGVTAINAAVTWQYVQDGPNGPEIEANLDIPDRDMKVRFALHKNTDNTLPASHLIEVTVDTPADFPGQSISEIPRIVLKPSEEARGQPLVGAAAKVADGFFWIALSANQNDIASNLALLRSRDWIDLPFVYGTGQRAILTFEKGPAGEKVFEDAITAWGTG